MTVAVVQHTTLCQAAGSHSDSGTVTFSAATAGNLLVLVAANTEDVNGPHFHEPSGWTRRTAHADHPTAEYRAIVATKVAAGGETSVSMSIFNSGDISAATSRTMVAFLEISGTWEGFVENGIAHGGHNYTLPSLTPTSGLEALLIGVGFGGNAHGINAHPANMTALDDDFASGGASDRINDWYRSVPSASGSYGDGYSYTGDLDRWYGVQLWASEIVDNTPVPDFTYDLGDGFEPQTVAFTDTSDPKAGTITAWAWDFGDGGTSTSQNPSHLYAHGTFTVTLTITVASVGYDVSHSVSILVDVGYTPPLPGLALVEIYATSPGSARWDLANWDEAVWSSDSWQNVTPESTDVTIIWGSQRPELGILSTPDAQSWGIGFYDPQRLLDPANADSPFFGDIVPGLPVRITHRGATIRQGVLESAGHNFDLNSFKTHHSGYFRVTDSQSLMARSKVPSDTTLGDDLFSRARDAIAAAGLSIHVAPETWASSPLGDVSPIGHVHDLVPWVTGTDWTVWQWISDAAAQVLHVPYIDHLGRLGFRQWNLPKDFGKALRSPNLVGLGSVIFQNGTYSVVKALDDDGVTLRTAELTPKPYYGAVTYDERATKPTPNAQDWADAVLADRAVAGLRWVPGEVFPLTANDVHYFAEIEAIERVSIDYPEANPPISVTGVVVGGQIVITPVQEREARWSFLFQVANTADQPLVDDDSPTDFLVNDDDPTDYLYPG